MNKIIIFLLGYFPVLVIYSMEPLLEEGWRLRNSFIVEYETSQGQRGKQDFEKEHRMLECLEKYLQKQMGSKHAKNNIALARFSLIVETDKDEVIPLNVPAVLRKKRLAFPVFMSGMGSQTGELIEAETCCEGAPDLCCVMASGPVSRKKLEEDLQKRFGDQLRGSYLEHSHVHDEIKGDLELLEIIAQQNKALVEFHNPDIDTLKDVLPVFQSAEKIKDAFGGLQQSYLDSEQLLIEGLHEPICRGEFLKAYYKEKKEHKFNRVLGIVMNLHTRRSPCNKCAPALFRECERSGGLAETYKNIIAPRQGHSSPFFLLMTSFREYHDRGAGQRDVFYGIDRGLDTSIDPETFFPFYPLIPIDDKAHISKKIIVLMQKKFATSRQALCETPEELNRRKFLRFCRDHGGIETWRREFLCRYRTAEAGGGEGVEADA